MQLIIKFNKRFQFLLCLWCLWKYAWVIPLKYKERITITNAFQKILDEFILTPNKIWEDKANEFWNISMKSVFQNNDTEIEMDSTHNKGKSVVAERFIRALKNKIYKYMTSISKNLHIDKSDDTVT